MLAKEALHKYLDKQLVKEKKAMAPKKTKNAKPEKLVEAECLLWLRANGFSINVVESKAVYSVARGGYGKGQTNPGFSDLVGNDSFGRACFIELKAKGRRNNLSATQYLFLKEKIESNCFAICTDSKEHLQEVYKEWSGYATRCQVRFAKTCLLRALPVPPDMREDDSPLFD